jgi:hypothetical protein
VVIDDRLFPFAKRVQAIRFQVRKIAEADEQPKDWRVYELEMVARDILCVADELRADLTLNERVALARRR